MEVIVIFLSILFVSVLVSLFTETPSQKSAREKGIQNSENDGVRVHTFEERPLLWVIIAALLFQNGNK